MFGLTLVKRHVCKKDYVRNPASCNCENLKYLASIMDDSTITRDKNIESYGENVDAVSKSNDKSSFNEKK